MTQRHHPVSGAWCQFLFGQMEGQMVWNHQKHVPVVTPILIPTPHTLKYQKISRRTGLCCTCDNTLTRCLKQQSTPQKNTHIRKRALCVVFSLGSRSNFAGWFCKIHLPRQMLLLNGEYACINICKHMCICIYIYIYIYTYINISIYNDPLSMYA